MFRKFRKFWRSIGPGLITGAADNDASAIGTYTLAGARTGYSQLWVLLFILPFMIALQEMSARIGALSGCGLIGNIKRHYPVWLLVPAATIIVMANTFNVGANIYGMAGAVNLLIPLPIEALAILMSGIILLITIFLRYHQIVSIFKWISVSLFSYVLAFLAVDADWLSILKHTIIPSITVSKDFFFILFAVMGASVSPYLYFWQASEEAEDFKQEHPRVRVCKFRVVPKGTLQRIDTDTALGMFFSNFISFFILALSATTLYQVGDGHIETLREAAQMLHPLVGEYAFLLFSAGIVGSGLIAIPVLAGSAAYVLAELFNWHGSLDDSFSRAREFYIVMTLAVTAGLLIPFLGITPIQALFYTAVLNGLISPLLIILIVHMANNPQIVGPNTSRPLVNYLGYAIFFLMTAGAVFVFIS